MFNLTLYIDLFACCILLILSVQNKWHKSIHLDELPEYKRSVLEVMRQPLEDRKITVSRAKMGVEYPAGFMLVAAMNHLRAHAVIAPRAVRREEAISYRAQRSRSYPSG